jgi:hypothetical protein
MSRSPNNAHQAAPGFAFLFFLARRPAAPELLCWAPQL